jgi:hypothetical protein
MSRKTPLSLELKARLAAKARIIRATESPEKRAIRLEKAKLYQREWRKNNPNRLETRLCKQRYKKSLKGKISDSKHRVARRTGIKQATPIWADLHAIGEAYLEAAYMGLDVDHIIPLRNKLVCGLHTWDNLQLLDPIKNNQKGNRHWPNMPA